MVIFQPLLNYIIMNLDGIKEEKKAVVDLMVYISLGNCTTP